jgi:hypothetical protein
MSEVEGKVRVGCGEGVRLGVFLRDWGSKLREKGAKTSKSLKHIDVEHLNGNA